MSRPLLRRRVVRRLAALALGLMAGAAPAQTNPAALVSPGTPAGEPVAALAGLRIARETLTLDLRPIAAPGGPRVATVEAVYGVVNSGPARRLPVELVDLGPAVEAAQVWVDEQPVAGEPLARLAVPALWTGIDSTVGIGGGAVPYAAEAGTPRGVRFVLGVGPGVHRVRVRYRVRPGAHDAGDHPNRTWQVVYSLAPARLWAGFGQLDVEIRTPDGWDVATTLPVRDAPDAEPGARATARFAGLPGDILGVSARAPAPAGRRALHALAFLAALAVAAVVGALGGVATARAGWALRWALPVSLLGGVGAAAVLLMLRGAADSLGDSLALGLASVTASVTVLGPAVLVLGTAVAQLVAVQVARRVRPAPETAPGAEVRN